MFTQTDIAEKAWLVREVVEAALQDRRVDNIFLIGSYARGTATDWSDLDYLVKLENPLKYPDWQQTQEIQGQLNSKRIHVIFGTKEAQESLQIPYKEIQLPRRRENATTH